MQLDLYGWDIALVPKQAYNRYIRAHHHERLYHFSTGVPHVVGCTVFIILATCRSLCILVN